MKFKLFGRTWTHWRLIGLTVWIVTTALLVPVALVGLAFEYMGRGIDRVLIAIDPVDWFVRKHKEYVSR